MHAPTLGTLMHMDDLARRADEARSGDRLVYIRRRLHALNFQYGWTLGMQRQAALVNRLLWRFDFMFLGRNDCELADLEGALPNQHLYPRKWFMTGGGGSYQVIPAYRQPPAPMRKRRGQFKVHILKPRPQLQPGAQTHASTRPLVATA
jgi:hypothetical protein